MIAAEIIAKKRDGGELTPAEIDWLIDSFLKGHVADYQMAAWAMAVCIRGMSITETVCLTRAMLNSGDVLPPSGSLPRVDKHSTGGLGDKVSLILAPALAVNGVAVPMLSGRGLGITGGTLDKLESIPGYRTDLTVQQIDQQVEQVGCVICGASQQLAPADRCLYALRDVTGTVESIPLITASILSKKVAESISSLILDVKWGSGTFMPTLDDARQLAQSLVVVGNRLGVATRAVITDMNQPLGRMVGNSVEVEESVQVLQGGGPDDVRQVTQVLGGWLLWSEGIADSEEQGQAKIASSLEKGTALAKFEQMVNAQDGRLPAVDRAPHVLTVEADRAGYVSAIDGRRIGQAMIQLGGGRRLAGQAIDPSVGMEMLVRLGQSIRQGDPLIRVWAVAPYAEETSPPAAELMATLQRIVTIDSDSPAVCPGPLICEIVEPSA